MDGAKKERKTAKKKQEEVEKKGKKDSIQERRE